MVEVRIRTENDDTGRYLCDWPIKDLAGLIRELMSWGVFHGEGISSDMSGQFVVDPPHFEIAVGTE